MNGSSAIRDTPLEAEPGTVEAVVQPEGLDAVRAADKLLTVPPDTAVLYYYRPDGNYGIWSVWLWKDGQAGKRLAFTGTTNGAAYLFLDRSAWFPRTNSRLNFRISTENFSSSDPGFDQSCFTGDGDRFAVLSHKKTVYTLGPYVPRILWAEFFEDTDLKQYVRVKLSGKYGLEPSVSANGFAVSGGGTSNAVRVVDAFDFAVRHNPDNRNRNYSDTVLLVFQGKFDPAGTYTVSHTVYGGARPIDLSRLPAPAPELSPAVIAKLPMPVLPAHPDWVELYYAAWKFMHANITKGNTTNGFVPLYIDEGFNENIYQWDSCFMTLYAVYGIPEYPAMPTLDNFYNHQKADGYICRCYNENTGKATGSHDINPPLFAWAEWRYYRLTGDASRLPRVLPVLDKYYQWVKNNCRGPNWGGLYYITDLGSGMDNSPREAFVRRGAWVDLSAQQALAALCISRLAKASGQPALASLASRYDDEFEAVKSNVNALLWDADAGTYYDRTESGALHKRNTIASFWTMLAQIASPEQAGAMISKHLRNPAEFYRAHLFPTLAANDPDYDGYGHYWRGGVWAPTDFAVIKGIERFDDRFAYEAASNHIANMAKVYTSFDPDTYRFRMPSLSEPNIPRNGDGVRQIWELYAPDHSAPGTRWDALLLPRQKFCGWSGVGPVALLIENVLGFDADGANGTLTWRLHMAEKHGIERLKFGGVTVSIEAEAREGAGTPLTVTYSADKKFRLVVVDLDGRTIYDAAVPAGTAKKLTVTPAR